MVTDPIKRINKKLFVGKPLDSQRKELPGDHIDIGERWRQLGCNDLGIEVLPGETGKLVLHARIYNHAYSFDVNGQKGNPVLPVQKLMQKIESSHDLW